MNTEKILTMEPKYTVIQLHPVPVCQPEEEYIIDDNCVESCKDELCDSDDECRYCSYCSYELESNDSYNFILSESVFNFCRHSSKS